jgi:seryl-tRNA synthetase
MRYRTTEGNETVHTLNSTAIATSRALVAILEQNQMKDGRVSVPEALRPYMGGQEILEPLH